MDFTPVQPIDELSRRSASGATPTRGPPPVDAGGSSSGRNSAAASPGGNSSTREGFRNTSTFSGSSGSSEARRDGQSGARAAGGSAAPGGDPRRRNAVDIRQRIAWVAGGTGLVGRSLLPLLLASQRYAAVHALVRSQASSLPPSLKLHRHRVDFSALSTTPSSAMAAADDCYILLGTTIKEAGSQAGFRRVDFDAVLATARAARAAGASRVAVISALGADKSSRVFYNRVKGEMEHAIGQLGFRTVVIAQPSLLVGDRRSLGQARRPAEEWSLRLLLPLSRFIPAKWRPIEARTVARAVYRGMIESHPGVRILSSTQMLQMGR
jgi:uncharacterized protein YbjT (DUF2867 family)